MAPGPGTPVLVARRRAALAARAAVLGATVALLGAAVVLADPPTATASTDDHAPGTRWETRERLGLDELTQSMLRSSVTSWSPTSGSAVRAWTTDRSVTTLDGDD